MGLFHAYIYRYAYSTHIYRCAGDASSPGGDASPRRHCQVGVRYPNLAIRKCIVFACQGIEPWQANADAGTRRPQVRTRCLLVRTRRPQVRTRSLRARTYAYIIFTLRRFLFHVSFSQHNALIINTFKRWNIGILCFIFDFNVSVVFLPLGFDFSPIEVLNRSHWGFISLPLSFLERGVVNKKWNIGTKNETLKPKMKHWNLKWNIERQCFISWSVWFSMSWNIKMKHEIFFTIVYNTYTRARRGKFAKKENRQNSVIKKKKWLLFPYMDFLGLFCR